MTADRYELRPIGFVESELRDPSVAPPQADEGAPEAWLVIRDELEPALHDLTAGERIVVVTWLHRADRRVLAVHPRGDETRPLHGVFSTRAPDRPNPIGLHEVEMLAVDGTSIRVRNLEAIHGTPVLDIKPVLGPPDTR